MNLFAQVQNIMSQNFKGWAFTVSLDGARVSINTIGNAVIARKALVEAGLDYVEVYCNTTY